MPRLKPMIPMTSPRGACWAFWMTDYSEEHPLYFTVIQDEDGSIWTWDNTKVRGQKNITLGRTLNRQYTAEDKAKDDKIVADALGISPERVGVPLVSRRDYLP